MYTKFDPKTVAEAYIAIARANHYMVGLCYIVSKDTLEKAEQILITQSNEKNNSDLVIERALDLIYHELHFIPRTKING